MNRSIKSHNKGLIQDFLFLFFGIIFAIVISRFGLLNILYESFEWHPILISLIAGFFFTSVFTVATATVFISFLSTIIDPSYLLLFGAVGATIADSILFAFIKDRLIRDAEESSKRIKKFHRAASKSFFSYIAPIIGAIIIASPLPDEIGLSLMGFTKVKFRVFLITDFLCNLAGILAIIGITSLLSK